MRGWSADMADPYVHEALPPLGFDNYRRNLESLLAVAAAHGARVVIATQALARYHLDGAASKESQLAGFDRIQDVQRAVAREHGVLLVDSARVVEAAIAAELALEVEKLRAEDGAATREVLERRAKDRLHQERMPALAPAGGPLFKHEVHPYDAGSDLIARTIADGLLAADALPK